MTAAATAWGNQLGQGAPSRGGKHQVVIELLRSGHGRSRRTASTPRTTSPRAWAPIGIPDVGQRGGITEHVDGLLELGEVLRTDQQGGR